MRRFQKGFIQNLILPSLILMGVVVMGWGQIMNQNQVGLNIARSADLAREQLAQVRSVLNWCRVMYPGGDNGMGHHKNMPASPLDESWVSLRTITCPGNVAAGSIWAAAKANLSMPALYLAEWEYRVIAGGVYLRLSVASPGDSYGRSVLEQVARRLHASEKNLTGDTLEIKFSG